MCRRKISIVGGVVTRKDYLRRLAAAGVKPISKSSPIDKVLSIVSKAELDAIAPSLVYPAGWYINELWDCDDYALQAQLDAGKKCVSVRLCIGYAPGGKHGFSLAMDTDLNIWVLENNAIWPWAGVWHKPVRKQAEVNDGHYLPEKIFI